MCTRKLLFPCRQYKISLCLSDRKLGEHRSLVGRGDQVGSLSLR